MAIDSEQKRKSIASVGQVWLPPSVVADGSITVTDRQQIAYSYVGISPPALDTALFYINSVPMPESIYIGERYEVGLANQYRTGTAQALKTVNPPSEIKYGYRLGWRLLTETLRDDVRTAYENKSSVTLIVPNTTDSPFTIQPVPGSWRQTLMMIAGGGMRYNVEFTVEMV